MTPVPTDPTAALRTALERGLATPEGQLIQMALFSTAGWGIDLTDRRLLAFLGAATSQADDPSGPTLPGLRWWRDGAMVNWSDGGDPDDNGFVADAASDDDAQRLVDEYNQLARERDLAVTHDRQPYPTAWAYEQVCRRLHELETAAALRESPDGE